MRIRPTGNSKIGLQILLYFTCLWLALITPSSSQVNPVSSEKNIKSEEIPQSGITLRVAVEEVRLDAVVVDKNGNQITDLTADDFSVYQDGRVQKINSCTYISDDQAPAAKTFASGDSSRTAPVAFAPPIPRDKVRRTITFVVDDLSMSFRYLHYARMALQKYVNTRMQPGDLISIIQTSGGSGGFQQFSSDKKALLQTIKNLRWGKNTICGSNGCGTYAEKIEVGLSEAASESEDVEESAVVTLNNRVESGAAFMYEKRRLFEAQMATIHYAIRALQDLPGRKSMILMSSQTTYTAQSPFGYAFGETDASLIKHFEAVADEALRAGVVIHTLDTKALSDVTINASSPFENYLPFSKKTGGVLVDNSNFLENGIGPIEQQLKGFYLLSYTPPENTFSQNRGQIYHKIRIKTKRRGSTVHTRDGFFGTTNPSYPPSSATADPLVAAVFSPFLNSDLNLGLASAYAYTPKTGYFLRSWLHLDPRNLTFIEKKDGVHSLSLELMTLTSDADGKVHDSKGQQYTFNFKNDDYARIREEGVDFEMYLPVKNPGAYYVRAAIRDRESAKIGSAYQFLEIPDLKKNNLSLSSIFVLNRNEDASTIKAGNTSESGSPSDPSRKWQVGKSPAVRSYMPGESFNYAAMIYNAKTQKGTESKLQSQFILYKNGKEYLKEKPKDIDLNEKTELGGIPITKRMVFNKGIGEGSYVLQLMVTDTRAKKNPSTAVQILDFQILKGKTSVAKP